MGKRPEDLIVDNTPFTDDPRGTDWYRFLTEIDELLGTGEYTWAESTLQSIQLTVERTKRVTDGQRRAVDNIEAGGKKSRGRGRPNYFGKYQGR